MWGRSLRPFGVAVLISLAALAGGSLWAPTAPRGLVPGSLTGPQIAHAQSPLECLFSAIVCAAAAVGSTGARPQSLAPCTFVSCQKDYSSQSAWLVTLKGDVGLSSPYLMAGEWTLYTLSNDRPGSSSCTSAECNRTWPPFLSPQGGVKIVSAGIPGPFGTITDSYGDQQVTYKDLPLYFYSGDVTYSYYSGDVIREDRKGDGVTDQWGTWSVAKP